MPAALRIFHFLVLKIEPVFEDSGEPGEPQVILSSTPWGGPEHFLRQLGQRGIDHPDDQVASWHWPSSISPLVDRALLDSIREREPADYFRRECLAEWTDVSGAFLTEAEIMSAVADYELLPPERVPHVTPNGRVDVPIAAGVDWGVQRDANAVVLLGMLDRRQVDDGRWRLYIPHLEARHGWPWSQFIDRVCDISAAYPVRVVASETNGVGAYPTDDLRSRLFNVRRLDTVVAPVWTDMRRKQSGFGQVKGLLQAGRLVLPNHPPLLRELRALEFEQLDGGGVRIAVPERSGHDDLAMALMQAASCVNTTYLTDAEPRFGVLERPAGSMTATGGGVPFPARPRPEPTGYWIKRPTGREKSVEGVW